MPVGRDVVNARLMCKMPDTLWCDPKPVEKGNFRYKFYRLDYDQVRYLFEDYDGVSPIIVDVPIVSIELDILKMKEKEKENV